MKITVMAAILVVALGGALVLGEAATMSSPTTAPTAGLTTEKQRISYTIGLQIGSNLKGADVEDAALISGLHDALSGAKPKLTQKELQDSIMALQKQLMAAQMAAGDSAQKAGETFLAENGKKEGVVTTASGLQYKVVKSGTGKSPKATDTVSVNYRGTLINGKEFDASHGKPVSFPVNRVIAGWTEALQLMKEGDTWILYIPSKLAYGDRGAGEDIGPNETLIFEVELISVK